MPSQEEHEGGRRGGKGEEADDSRGITLNNGEA
jgi:hypothetical protein